MTRRWPVLAFSTYGLAGAVFSVLGILDILGLRRHGFSQLFGFAVGAAMVVLSVVWLITTLRTKTPLTNRTFSFRNLILILLLLAHQFAYL